MILLSIYIYNWIGNKFLQLTSPSPVPGRFTPNPVRPGRFDPIPVRTGSFRPHLLSALKNEIRKIPLQIFVFWML